MITVTAKPSGPPHREGLAIEGWRLPTVDFTLEVGVTETVVEVSVATPASVQVIPLGGQPIGIDASPDGTEVSNFQSKLIAVIDTTTDRVVQIFASGGDGSVRLQFTADRKQVWVTNLRINELVVFDVAERHIVRRILRPDTNSASTALVFNSLVSIPKQSMTVPLGQRRAQTSHRTVRFRENLYAVVEFSGPGLQGRANSRGESGRVTPSRQQGSPIGVITAL